MGLNLIAMGVRRGAGSFTIHPGIETPAALNFYLSDLMANAAASSRRTEKNEWQH